MWLLPALVAVGLVMAGSGLAPGSGSAGSDGDELGGFAVTHVPEGVGPNVSDFSYEWGDVAFVSRVWERETGGGHQVDLQILVLRGKRLTGPAELRDFLAEYHERDPARWELREFRHDASPGFIGDGEVFWLVEPGVAVEVRLSSERFGEDELRATALGVLPAS